MASSEKKVVLKRYYIQNSVVPFEEDSTHEFKGHRSLSIEEIPPTAFLTGSNKRSRQAVSRTINGFLNTGEGGTCYLGITDDGVVKGIKLTQHQKDHVVTSLDDLASRYDPPLEKHRYKVKFVPVLDEKSADDERCSALTSIARTSDSSNLDRERPHVCRTHTYCWCDNDAIAVLNNGIHVPDYVIEITIKAWDPEDERNQALVLGTDHKLPPFHSDEEGHVYFRRQASLVTYTPQEIWTMTKQEVREKCQEEIDMLKKEILRLKGAP